MKVKQIQQKIRISLALLMGVFGLSACDNFKANNIGEEPSILCKGERCDGEIGGKYLPKAVETFSVVNQGQVLKSMVSCTGLQQASQNTQNVYKNSKNSFSLEGAAASVNAPMWMAITSLAGEVCRDLVSQESAQESANRKIFTHVDFSGNPTSLEDSTVAQIVRKMARACWGRNETKGELDTVLGNFRGTFSSGDNIRSATMFLCTGVLSSLSANQM